MDPAEYTIELIRSEVNGEPVPEKPEEFGFNEVYEFSHKHKLENICYEAVKKLNNKPDENLMKQWRAQCAYNTSQMVNQEFEKQKIESSFSAEGIYYLPMKGWFLRSMYPQEDFRFMSDLDILVDKKSFDKASLIMQELGYNKANRHYGVDESFIKSPYLNVELKYDMISPEFKLWYDYYQRIWKIAWKESEYKYILEKNDYYIYMVVNLAKDYYRKGTGVRSILDFYVFLEKSGCELNRNYIKEELNKLALEDFCEDIEKLSYKWFGKREYVINDNEKSDMEDKILHDGIYGSLENLVGNRLQEVSGGDKADLINRITYLRKRAFPDLATMKYKYRVLEKYPVFLPFSWIYRLGENFKRAVMEIIIISRKKQR